MLTLSLAKTTMTIISVVLKRTSISCSMHGPTGTTPHALSRVTLVAVSMMVMTHVASKPVAEHSNVPISKSMIPLAHVSK